MMKLTALRTLVAGTAALAVVVSGCSTDTGSEGADTLTVLSNIQSGTPTGDVQDDVIAAFEQETGKDVELVQVGETIPDVFETSVAGGKEADVVMINLAEKTNNWVEQGIVVPASQYLDDWGLADRIKPEALKAWTNADGEVQGFPYNGFVWPVWFNMELLGEAGIDAVPTTADELLADVGLLKDAGIPPMIVGGNDWSGQKLFLQIAQSYMDPTETTKVYSEGGYCASENAMKGIKYFTQLRDAGLFVDDAEGYTADQMNASFYEGKAAIMSAGSWAFGDTPDAQRSNLMLGGFPVPAGGAYEKPTAYEGYTGGGIFVSNNGAKDDKIELVKQFITSWYEPEVAAAWAQAANGPTAVVTDDSDSAEIENTVTAQAVNDLPDRVAFAVMPDTVVPGSLADPMIRQTSVAFAPGTDAQAICASMDALYK